MATYAVGQTVRVRKDLVENVKYGGVTALDPMVEMGGCEGKISRIKTFDDCFSYKIEDTAFSWTAEMLELVEEDEGSEDDWCETCDTCVRCVHCGEEDEVRDEDKFEKMTLEELDELLNSITRLPELKSKPKNEVAVLENKIGFELYLERAIFNDPATILFYRVAECENGEFKQWSETEKIVAKCNKDIGDTFDHSKGVEVAILKAYKREIEKTLKKY